MPLPAKVDNFRLVHGNKPVDVFNSWKGAGANVQVAANSWNKYLGGNAVIVLPWCFNKQSSEGWMKNAGLKF